MPYLSDKFSWSSEKIAATRDTVFKILACHGIRDIEHFISCEDTITPEDLFRLTYSNRGSIYGISSNSRHAAFQRQANRAREVHGLYFAGGSVHPGGGIPLVLLSGKHAASLIARYHPLR
jgi:phytoene dehydrogenase-like protein